MHTKIISNCNQSDPYDTPGVAAASKSVGGLSIDDLNTASHDIFSSDVSANNGNVLVGVFNTNEFSPPPNSGGAVSSTENPSEELPNTISPSGKAS